MARLKLLFLYLFSKIHAELQPGEMKIVFLQTGKTAEKYISDGIAIFSERITRLTGFEIITVPDLRNTRSMPPAEQMIREGRLQLQHTGKDDLVVLLDRRGKRLDTIAFANELGRMMMTSKKRIIFLAGGPWGVSEEVFSRADFVLSLSDMTFSHQMVRLLFMEQLYRVVTILKGIPYHH